MSKSEKYFLGIFLGAIPPLIGFLVGWWSTCQFLSEIWVSIAALSGLVMGFVVDAFFFKKWVSAAFEMDLKLWMAIFFFYSICVFGFFMGVPIFNLVLALPAGWFIGRKLARQTGSEEIEKRLPFKTKLFTTSVFFFICASSAFLALRDPTTAANLEGMLRLNFNVTQGMIIALIAVGGAGVLGLNWWLVKIALRYAQRKAI